MIQKTHSTGHTFSKSATLRENHPKIPANFWGRGRLVEEDLSAEMLKLAQSTKVTGHRGVWTRWQRQAFPFEMIPF